VPGSIVGMYHEYIAVCYTIQLNHVPLQLEDCATGEQSEPKQKGNVSNLLGDNMKWNVVCSLHQSEIGLQTKLKKKHTILMNVSIDDRT
jgi:hypothetical protein